MANEILLAPWHGARALRSRAVGESPVGLCSIPASCGIDEETGAQRHEMTAQGHRAHKW